MHETELRLALITDGKAEALAGPAVSAARQLADNAASANGHRYNGHLAGWFKGSERIDRIIIPAG